MEITSFYDGDIWRQVLVVLLAIIDYYQVAKEQMQGFGVWHCGHTLRTWHAISFPIK